MILATIILALWIGSIYIFLAFDMRNCNNRIDALERRILHLERKRQEEKDRLEFLEAERCIRQIKH